MKRSNGAIMRYSWYVSLQGRNLNIFCEGTTNLTLNFNSKTTMKTKLGRVPITLDYFRYGVINDLGILFIIFDIRIIDINW